MNLYSSALSLLIVSTSFIANIYAYNPDTVSIQCKDYMGHPVVELVYNTPAVWEGYSSMSSASYVKNPDLFRPKASDIVYAKTKYRTHHEDLFFNATSEKQVIKTTLVESQDRFNSNLKSVNLVITFDETTNTRGLKVPFYIANLHSVSSSEIYYNQTGYFEHGGVIHGFILNEPVLCVLDQEGFLRSDFKL